MYNEILQWTAIIFTILGCFWARWAINTLGTAIEKYTEVLETMNEISKKMELSKSEQCEHEETEQKPLHGRFYCKNIENNYKDVECKKQCEMCAILDSGVSQQRELLFCVVDYLSNFTKGKNYECKPDGKNHFEVYDDFGDWYSVHKKCFSKFE